MCVGKNILLQFLYLLKFHKLIINLKNVRVIKFLQIVNVKIIIIMMEQIV